MTHPIGKRELVHIQAGQAQLEGNLSLPDGARGVVLFAHGSGSSRFSIYLLSRQFCSALICQK